MLSYSLLCQIKSPQLQHSVSIFTWLIPKQEPLYVLNGKQVYNQILQSSAENGIPQITPMDFQHVFYCSYVLKSKKLVKLNACGKLDIKKNACLVRDTFKFSWVDKSKHISSQILLQKNLPHQKISHV